MKNLQRLARETAERWRADDTGAPLADHILAALRQAQQVQREQEKRIAKGLLFLLASAGYATFKGMLMAHAAPAGKAAWERMKAPQPGDLVLETSTVWQWFRGGVSVRAGAIGVLSRTADEPFPEAVEADEGVTERVWYIEALDGTGEARWVNADFIALLGLDEQPVKADIEPLASLLDTLRSQEIPK